MRPASAVALRRIESAAKRVKAGLSAAVQGLIDREALVELIALSAVAEEHLLVIGPPGTAKSEAVRRVAQMFGGSYFEYLLGRFTEPSEIFGPVDLRKLKDGIVETQTQGMLPEADIAFLDEVFLGSTAILNTLLGLLNERTFRRGHTRITVPLRVCVGASNGLPDDDALSAFADRFLVHVFVKPIEDPRLEDLLEGGWALSKREVPAIGLQTLTTLTQGARAMDVSGMTSTLAQAIRLLRQNGIDLSDRRAVKIQSLVAAAAALAGRTTPTEADLWPIIYAVPTETGQHLARDVLKDLLQTSESASLPASSEQASRGPAARALRLVNAANELLEAPPENPQDRGAWQLKLEGIAREIDAGFIRNVLPTNLVQIRTQIIELLGAGLQDQLPAPPPEAPP